MIAKKADRFYYYASVDMNQIKLEQKVNTDLRFDYFISILDETNNMQDTERYTNYFMRQYE